MSVAVAEVQVQVQVQVPAPAEAEAEAEAEVEVAVDAAAVSNSSRPGLPRLAGGRNLGAATGGMMGTHMHLMAKSLTRLASGKKKKVQQIEDLTLSF